MDPQLRNQLKNLDDELIKLLEVLKDYRESDLNRQPRPGAWSPLQVMHHLMRSEALSYKYVVKKLSFNPVLKNRGLGSTMRSAVLRLYLRSPFKRKAPDNLGDEVLPRESSFWETAKQWKSQREELAKFLEQLPNDYVKKEIYKHPAIGRLTLPQMLQFFGDHFHRHRKQIKKALIFPPN